ncbi:MAG TPA: TetR/AcrR family transcriptional regulator [Bacillota bacterium]|nr:TetR/AcrR family transcriptional regulator [Bacillota bacterium]
MPRKKDASERIRDERRDLLLHHALRLFVRKGLSATRMKDIAEASGVSQGLAYHYFASKEDIFVELIRDAYTRMSEAALGLQGLPLPPDEKIHLATQELLAGFAHGESAALNFLLVIQASVFDAVPEEAKAIVQGRSLLHEVIAGIVSEGQTQGTFKNFSPADMAMLFWSALAGLAILKASLGDEFAVPDYQILVGMLTKDFSQEE